METANILGILMTALGFFVLAVKELRPWLKAYLGKQELAILDHSVEIAVFATEQEGKKGEDALAHAIKLLLAELKAQDIEIDVARATGRIKAKVWDRIESEKEWNYAVLERGQQDKDSALAK